jgi:hypothetical protein
LRLEMNGEARRSVPDAALQNRQSMRNTKSCR